MELKELTCDKSSPIDSLGRGSHKVWVKRKEIMAHKLWEKNFEVNKEIERFTVGRDRELDLYLAEKKNKIAQACFRINPDVGAHTHANITTGLAENKLLITSLAPSGFFL